MWSPHLLCVQALVFARRRDRVSDHILNVVRSAGTDIFLSAMHTHRICTYILKYTILGHYITHDVNKKNEYVIKSYRFAV